MNSVIKGKATLLITHRRISQPPPRPGSSNRSSGNGVSPCSDPGVCGLAHGRCISQASRQAHGSSQRSPPPPVLSSGPHSWALSWPPRVTQPGPPSHLHWGGQGALLTPPHHPSAAELKPQSPEPSPTLTGPDSERSTCRSPETSPRAHTASTQGPTVQGAVTPKPGWLWGPAPRAPHGSLLLPPASI